MSSSDMFSIETFVDEAGARIKNHASHPLLKDLASLLEQNPNNQLAWGLNQYFLFATNREGLDWIKLNLPDLPMKATLISDDIVEEFKNESLLFFLP